MTDEDPVGSVAEEAVKLFGALQDWARADGQEPSDAASHVASAFQSLNEHLATGGEDCKYCPICRLISAVRRTSPEVKQHLSTAATSVLQAAAAAMATDGAHGHAESGGRPVERIDLSDDAWNE